jgi:stage III sporulation protein AE
LAAIAAVLVLSLPVQAASVPHLVHQQIQSLNTASLQHEINRMVAQNGGTPLPSIEQIVQNVLHHKMPVNPASLLQSAGRALWGDLAAEGRLLGILFLLTVLAALLARLGDTLSEGGRSGVAAIAHLVVVSALILVALHSFETAIQMVQGVVGSLVHFMESLIPLLMVLVAGSGAVASAGIFHPLMLVVTNLVAVLTKRWVLPLVLMATLVELVSVWLPKYSLRTLGGLLRQVGLTLLGGLMTLFLGVVAIEGAAGSVADGISLRTGKFLANTFVPVVGKMFSDAMEAVLGSSLLLKNAVSIFGALGIIALVLFPIVKLFAMALLYRVAAAGSEPLGVAGVGEALNLMATALGWLVAVAGAVAMMFFLVVTVVVTTTNGVQL